MTPPADDRLPRIRLAAAAVVAAVWIATIAVAYLTGVCWWFLGVWPAAAVVALAGRAGGWWWVRPGRHER